MRFATSEQSHGRCGSRVRATPEARRYYDWLVELLFTLVGVLAVILGLWVSWTTSRLNRLATRTDSARASLDAQLVRRAAAAQALADQDAAALEPALSARLRSASRRALESDPPGRESAENELSRVLIALPAGLNPELLRDLSDASARVVLARRFYNDAVRDSRSLRSRRLARLFRLAAHRPNPAFFEIADVLPPSAPASRAPVETG